MKKILLLLLITTFSAYSQNVSKEKLVDQFKLEFKFDNFKEAFVILKNIEQLYGVTPKTKYYNCLLSFYSCSDRIDNQSFLLLSSTIKRLTNQIELKENTEKDINSLRYFRVVLQNSLLYYKKFRDQLTNSEKKNIADFVKEETLKLNKVSNLVAKALNDLKTIQKDITSMYDYYTTK